VSLGPYAVRFGPFPAVTPHAGTVERVTLEVENAGSLPWRGELFVSYHWLDTRDNPIHWDGIRTRAPELAPGERATVAADVRAPIPPGTYRLAFDLVAELRAWFSELGSPLLAQDVDVEPRAGEPNAALPAGWARAPDWEERVRAAHAEGYGVVAGAVSWPSGVLHRRPRELTAYEPGQGRVPGFSAPLLAPSVLPGIDLEPLGELAGLPAFAAPRDEPWVFDGRIVIQRLRQ
jgi:hypothetical protein